MQAIFEDIKHVMARSSPAELRKFGLTVGLVLGALGGFLFWKHSSAAPYFAGVAAALIGFGLVAPRLLKPVYIAWMSLAVVLGFIMTRVILTVLFSLVFVPAGVVMRILRKDPLKQRYDPQAQTYWVPRERTPYAPEQTEKQF